MDVVVGRIGRAHGLRGEVAVEVLTDEPDRRFAIGEQLRPDPSSHRVLTVAAARPQGERLLVRFEEAPDRTAAESLRGATLHAEVDPVERPDDDEEFYDRQLVGLDVRTDDSAVGTVVDVLHLPAQDLLSVRTEDGRDVLVPFVSELVPRVDVEAGWLQVVDLPGLLDPGAAEEA